MRGTQVSRLAFTRAAIAGALLAGAALRPAAAEPRQARTPDEVALAMPRLLTRDGADGVVLPRPLPAGVAAAVRRALDLQRAGDLRGADAALAPLTDTTLLGTIEADRLLHHRAPAAALTAWLARYPDLPQAQDIYARLIPLLPARAARPAPPVLAMLGNAAAAAAPVPGSAALTALADGHDAAARRMGAAAWRRSHGRDPASAYAAGLAAWTLGDPAGAGGLFEAAALAPASPPGLRAAAAYWLARAALREGDAGWRGWMRRAMGDPLTLHGRLARQVLGIPNPPPDAHAILTSADIDAIAATSGGRRAFALLQVGEKGAAELEFRALWPALAENPGAARALLLVAGAAHLPSLSADLAAALGLREPGPALPRLRPAGGYVLDPALVYAVARVESGFDRHAASTQGAQGLMQLLPATLAALHGPAGRLGDAGTNLKYGQRYLMYLSHHTSAGDDLLRVLAAYNAGPAALARASLPADDPLLAIELMPSDETRRYVQTALLTTWRYADRLGRTAPSLVALAAGVWPRLSAELVQ